MLLMWVETPLKKYQQEYQTEVKVKKSKLSFKDYLGLFLGALGLVGGSLFAFVIGSRKRERELKKEKISVVKKESENVILKEKLADKDKKLNEISEDVDNILDRK